MVLDIIIGILQIILFPGILFCLGLAFFYEWIDRKYYADLQNRMGPLYTGWRGILQPFADFIKLMAKEDITPASADKKGFTIAPILSLTVTLFALMFIPIAGISGIVSFEGDLIFLMFVTTIIDIMIFLGGWFSNSRFSTIGAARSGLQLISYEIPMAIAAFTPALIAKTFSITGIVQYQGVSGMMLLFFPIPIAFGVYIIALMAELEKVPLDIPEAETEIVAGWQTEYSGKKYAFFRLANNLELVFGAGLAVALFLGGPYGIEKLPGLTALDLVIQSNIILSAIWYTGWFVLKTAIVVLIITNLRTLFSRYRIDQMTRGCWKYLTPIMIIVIVVIQLLAVAVPWIYPPPI
ncbi:MAG: complex I subunit 1/NuoH family protein [Candidatus Odinarchaeia archaeon]